MTETPSDPVGPGESSSEYGSAPPPPPPPAGAGYPAAPPSSYSGAEGQGYQPPPAYQPPPPGAEAPAAQPPLVADPAQYQAAPGYQPVPQAGYQEPTPATPAAATGFGQQFSNYDRTTLQSFNPRTVDPLDWGIIAAGLIAFIFSLFQFYKYTLSVAGVGRASESVSAWHGFFGWFGALVALLAALLLATELIAKIRFPFATRLAVLGAFVVALICELLALFIVPGDTGGLNGAFGLKIDKGHSFGYWITLIAVLAGTALAYKRFADTGGKLPRRG